MRDKGFGVPHVYGATRSRRDVRARLRGCRGPAVLHGRPAPRRAAASCRASRAASNAGEDAEQWSVAPYTEADLETPGRRPAEVPRRRRARRSSPTPTTTSRASTSTSSRPSSTRRSCPASTRRSAARSAGPFKPADIIATAAMVGGIFGKGGGKELEFSQLADALDARFGNKRGAEAFADFRAAEDAEAPVTVFDQRFPYQAPPKKVAAGSVARPDPGTLKLNPVRAPAARSSPASRRARPTRCWSPAQESASGHPLMVAGPQVGYFNPQILMEQDVHAPAGAGRARDRRPGRLVRRHQPLRPARPRARLRLERDLRRPGHHRHVRAGALRRHPLPLPRQVRADRGAAEDQPLGADARRPDRRRLADAAARSGPSSASSPAAARCAASR